MHHMVDFISYHALGFIEGIAFCVLCGRFFDE
jgi:hypothetical protein